MEALIVLNKKKIIAPKLRFKGFDDAWKRKTLFDISENISYGMNAAAIEYDGIHKYIRITDIDVNTGEFKPDPLTSPLGDIDERFKLKHGDIVFARTGASVGKSYLYNPKDGALYFAGFLIKFSITKANPFFVYSLTLKEAYNKWVHIYSMRSGQPGLNVEEYKGLRLNIPVLSEQQKIASFLLAVDEKIKQLNRKKKLLEKYKKGVMQQLFSGKLRFKEEKGKSFPKWKEKRLGDICEMTSSKRVYLSDYVERGIPFYRGKEITELKNNQRPKDILYITESRYEDYKSKYGVPKKDDILITAVGTLGNVLRIKNNNKFYFKDGNLIWLRNIKLNAEYLEVIIEWNKPELIKTSIGSTQRALTMVELRKINISVPCIEEQKKIADFLSFIDDKIESVNKQINQTQSFKKGLLQQMFV